MTKVYYDLTQPGIPYTFLLYPNLHIEHKPGKGLFSEKVWDYFSEPAVAVSERPEAAHFILLPHNYAQVKDNQQLLQHYIELAKKHNKRLIIFSYGDTDYDIDIPSAVIFKNALHRFKKKKNEIKSPLFVEDLGDTWGVDYQQTKKVKPSVGFCGWAEYANWRQRLRAALYHQSINLQKVLTRRPELETLKQGIYFRKKILQIFEGSRLVETQFIRRQSFGLHQNTISVPPEQSRREFVENIKNTDFSLAVRGDMNDSARLYEIMSLGRIPVLLDTECVLPFESTIDYEKCVIRIPYQKIALSAGIVSNFYQQHMIGDLVLMQKEVRRIFDQYLRIDSYFSKVFKGPDSLRALL